MPPHPNFLMIHLHITFPSTFSKWSLSLRFPHQNPVYNSPLPIPATCPTHLILLDLITRTIFGVEYKSLSSSLCSFLHSPVTSSLLKPNILVSLFSDILSLRSSFNVSDQVSTQITYTYTGCHRRNGPNFGRVFLMLNYTDITQNTYIQS